MKRPTLLRLFATCLALGKGVGVQGAQLDVSGHLERLAERSARVEEDPVALPAERGSPHEAILAPGMTQQSGPTAESPPAPILERPGESAPSPDSRWIEGYWDWDKTRGEFHWVTGAWRIPPPGKFWVGGYWRRSEGGWYRVPGFWSERSAIPAPTAGQAVSPPRDWRRTGPPAERPEETPGTPPAPDYFYIPGEYVPQGEGVVWRRGFWYRSQPGWEWNPVRWVRQATGWAFREGSWSRVAITPENGSALPDAAVVSTATHTGPSSNDTTVDPPAPIRAVASSSVTPGPTAATRPGQPGSTAPIGVVSNRYTSSMWRAATEPPPANIARPGQTAITRTPAESVSPPLGPEWFTPRPMPIYPDMPRIYPPRGYPRRTLMSEIGRFLNRFLPY